MRITGTGSAFPSRVVNNEELAQIVDTSDEWISTRTGIRARRVIDDESIRSLAKDAALRALQNAGREASDLDMILVSSSDGEAITPSTASLLLGEIGAHCPAMDLNAACAGFLYALDVADAYMQSGKASVILIVAAEAISRMCDWSDRATCVLFGDGAGAAVVERGDGLIATALKVQYNPGALNAYPPPGNSPFQTVKRPASPLKMAGQEVYKYAVTTSSGELRELITRSGFALNDVSHYVLHQANLRIIEAVCDRLGQPRERFPHNIERTGNTSSASVPILLDELNRADKLKPGELIALSAFGAGLTSGTALLRWTRQ